MAHSTRWPICTFGCLVCPDVTLRYFGSYLLLFLPELAKDCLVNKLNCQVVEGIISPVNDNYATSKYLAPAKHRCEMIRRALKPLNGQKHWVRVDEWECKQSQWSRTIEVLRHHREQVNKDHKDNVSLKLLCGADLFESFNVPDLWKDGDIEEILRDYGLIVITRKGSDPWQTLRNSSKSSLFLKYEVNSRLTMQCNDMLSLQANITIIEEKAKNGISSTLVR